MQSPSIVISPGSRNAPLTIGFASNDTFECFSIADERSAAFYALAIRLGYNAQFMQGNITKRGGGWTPHGWVRINGYNYDTQMENRYGYNGYGPYNQLNYQY